MQIETEMGSVAYAWLSWRWDYTYNPLLRCESMSGRVASPKESQTFNTKSSHN
jgi:hypothetical protein